MWPCWIPPATTSIRTLNIHAWSNCTDNQLVDHDVDGHGTHVGGTIGALDNDFGVVGVAPGARLWNIKVMRPDATGSSFYLSSWVICGLDLITRYATAQGDGLGDIDVANASLGGNGTDSNCQTNFNDLFHQAFCRTVAAGVPVVVAAMNNAVNAANGTPATYEEVITVSALADSDGLPGGVGPATRRGPDESPGVVQQLRRRCRYCRAGRQCPLDGPDRGVQSLSSERVWTVRWHEHGRAPCRRGSCPLSREATPGRHQRKSSPPCSNNREQIALRNDPDGINEGVLHVADVPPPPPPSNPPPPEVGPAAPGDVAAPAAADHKKKKKGKKKKKKH